MLCCVVLSVLGCDAFRSIDPLAPLWPPPGLLSLISSIDSPKAQSAVPVAVRPIEVQLYSVCCVLFSV